MQKYNLFLDDERSMDKTTWVKFPEGMWVVARNFKDFVSTIEAMGLPEFISFDMDLHDSHYEAGARSGYQLCDYEDLPHKTGLACARWLKEHCKKIGSPIPQFQTHSKNPGGRREITKVLTENIS